MGNNPHKISRFATIFLAIIIKLGKKHWYHGHSSGKGEGGSEKRGRRGGGFGGGGIGGGVDLDPELIVSFIIQQLHDYNQFQIEVR